MIEKLKLGAAVWYLPAYALVPEAHVVVKYGGELATSPVASRGCTTFFHHPLSDYYESEEAARRGAASLAQKGIVAARQRVKYLERVIRLAA